MNAKVAATLRILRTLEAFDHTLDQLARIEEILNE